MKDFEAYFGHAPALAAEASGRVNLIGEHTDYNNGFVLPTAIPQRTRVQLSPRGDDAVHVISSAIGAKGVEYRLGGERKADAWHDYLQGVTHILGIHGYPIRGFEAAIDSDVPMGSGLSSSAALEVALVRALRAAFSLDISDVKLAQLCQEVENVFVGARVGIMDPMAASLSSFGTALFLDTRDLSYRQIPLPMDEMDLIVINSGISHRNVGGGYNERREQCERACLQLGVESLRDISAAELSRVAPLPEPIRRRAKHVITENERVLAAVSAIESRDLEQLGALFAESHASMRDDYEVSIPEIDTLVDIASGEDSVYGARLTGGGFGGSVVIVAEKASGEAASKRICEAYAKRTGATPTVLVH